MAVARSAVIALRNVPTVLAYESPSVDDNFKPTVYIDIAEVFDLKWQALKCHKSQFAQKRSYLQHHKVRSVALVRGLKFGVEMAEAFEAYRLCLDPLLW